MSYDSNNNVNIPINNMVVLKSSNISNKEIVLNNLERGGLNGTLGESEFDVTASNINKTIVQKSGSQVKGKTELKGNGDVLRYSDFEFMEDEDDDW